MPAIFRYMLPTSIVILKYTKRSVRQSSKKHFLWIWKTIIVKHISIYLYIYTQLYFAH